MNHDENFERLWTDFLEGELTDEAIAELHALLAERPQLQREAANLLQTHRLLGFSMQDNVAAQDLFTRQVLSQLPQPEADFTQAVLDHASLPVQPRNRFRRSKWHWLTAVAGVAFGILCSSVVFAYASPKFHSSKELLSVLFNESFESGVKATQPGLPREAGVWTGDEARVVTAEQGVAPRSGGKMLRFVSATFPGENAPVSSWGDVYRLVDVRGLAHEGKTALRLAASFNSVKSPTGEEYEYSVGLSALDVEMSELPQPLSLTSVASNSSAITQRKFPIKHSGQWEMGTVEVVITPATRFVLIHLAMVQSSPKPASGAVRFSGHYLDDVKLEIVTQPETQELKVK